MRINILILFFAILLIFLVLGQDSVVFKNTLFSQNTKETSEVLKPVSAFNSSNSSMELEQKNVDFSLKHRRWAPLFWVSSSDFTSSGVVLNKQIEIVAPREIVNSVSGFLKQSTLLTTTSVIGPFKTTSSSFFAKSVISQASLDYYRQLGDILAKTKFTNDEFQSALKTEEGRVMLVEELLEKARLGEDLDNLKKSFLAWQRLDERFLGELEKITLPSSSAIFFHQVLLDWFKFHLATVQKLQDTNLDRTSLEKIEQEFKDRAFAHTGRLRRSLSEQQGLGKILALFTPQVQAVTCGAVVPPPLYHFGGRVVFMWPCDLGFVEAISPPCGGLLLFSYPVLAANPFLWKKPIIPSAVLGRSVLVPAFCLTPSALTCPACFPVPFEGVVLYFGSSLFP